MKMKILLSATLASACLFSSVALADGALLTASTLSASERSELTTWIANARATDAEPFQVLSRLEAEMPMLDAQKRGRFVPVTRSFRSYGLRALPAIVERLVFSGGAVERMTPSAETAFLSGIVQVLGEFVDPRVEPVLHALLDAPHITEFHLLYTVAGALGWHGTDAAESHLLQVSNVADDRQFAVLAGLGQLHSLRAVERLSDAIAAETVPVRRKWLIRSVRDAGNRGYWRLARKTNKSAGEWTVRLAAMQTLVAAFVANTDDVQGAAANSIMVVDHPETPAALAKAMETASPSARLAIEKLQKRFANPPLMRRRN